jgi:hypothetical protein
LDAEPRIAAYVVEAENFESIHNLGVRTDRAQQADGGRLRTMPSAGGRLEFPGTGTGAIE